VSLRDPKAYMFDTSMCRRRSKESVLKRLSTKQEGASTTEPIDGFFVSSTVLIEAVRKFPKDVTNVLLCYGADVYGKDEDGRTAVHHAAIRSDTKILSLLLSWSTESLDAVDRHGCTALAYATLEALKEPFSPCPNVDTLLDFGANPQAGGTLELAVRHNRLPLVLPMLHCATSSLQAATMTSKGKNNGRSVYRKGELVWVRFGGMRGSWQIATVDGVDGPMLNVILGENQMAETEQSRLCNAVKNVHQSWVCRVNRDSDAPFSAKKLLMEHFIDEQMSFGSRAELLRQRKGAEGLLLPLLKTSNPAVKSVLSTELKVGALVGEFVEESLLLQVGTVTAAHPNGLYNVQLTRGELRQQVGRTQLRPLRKELQLVSSKACKFRLEPALVHACVCPVDFGSYENMEMLRALSEAGSPIDGKNAKGKTPLELARPGSEQQKYLREMTKKPRGGRKESSEALRGKRGPPSLDGITLEKDARDALHDLHEQGAGVTERVVPEVNEVCELDSDGICVLMDGEEDYFDVALTKVDVNHDRWGKYVFYKMQVVEDPVQMLFVLLTNWGRIGEYGKLQQTPFSSQEECVKEFEKIFKSKTGNLWADRDSFVKKPKKYSLVQTRKSRVKDPEKLLTAAVENQTKPCSLDSSLEETLRFLLRPDKLMSYARLYGLDQSQLPLGELSLDTLDQAEAVLQEVKSNLEEPDSQDINEFRAKLEGVAELTNRFYELLPSRDQIVKSFKNDRTGFNKAVKLVCLLRDLSVTKQLLLGGLRRQEQFNPVDYAYKALQMRMEPLCLDSEERICVQRYIDSTCTVPHVVVNQIYSLDNGQAMNKDVGNKQLLFHGSKNENVLGILKQGLRVAPPEASRTGFAYGKGIYFSDQLDKACNYVSCLDSQKDTQPRAYVFVAEVALGTPYVTFSSEYMEKPRGRTNSTHAPGVAAPDPEMCVTLDNTGAGVPLGPVRKSIHSGPQYQWGHLASEHSYEIERVRMNPSTKFPAKVRFNSGFYKPEVRLVNGPFSDEGLYNRYAVASDNEMEENEESEESKEQEKSGDDEPDMYAFMKKHTNFDILRGCPLETWAEHSEFIVYDTEQVHLKYMIELTSEDWLKSTLK